MLAVLPFGLAPGERKICCIHEAYSIPTKDQPLLHWYIQSTLPSSAWQFFSHHLKPKSELSTCKALCSFTCMGSPTQMNGMLCDVKINTCIHLCSVWPSELRLAMKLYAKIWFSHCVWCLVLCKNKSIFLSLKSNEYIHKKKKNTKPVDTY